jgi:acyl-CoA thioesterase
MHNRLLIKHISFLLLIAMLFAVVPFHQIFHKHHFSTDTSKTVQVKKTEKPCCKPFEGLFGTTTAPQPLTTVYQTVSTVYLVSYFSYFIKPLFDLANKAPPVSLV